MNDEQIIEYLRSRAQVHAPLDLVGSVLDAVDAAPPRRAWFAPFVPAMSAAVAVAVVLGLAVLLGQRLNIGPPPEPSLSPSPTTPSPTETTSAEPSPTETTSAEPSPTSTATPAGDGLTQPGDSVEIPAVDASGEWGTILIRRGDDRGGYEDVEIGAGAFAVEVYIEYTAERMPEPAQFGYPEWVLRPTDPNAEHFFTVEPEQFDPARPAEVQPPLALYPGAVDIFTTPTAGWLIFEVADREANLELQLVYQPTGLDEEAAATVLVRVPGPAPTD